MGKIDSSVRKHRGIKQVLEESVHGDRVVHIPRQLVITELNEEQQIVRRLNIKSKLLR